MKFGTLIEPRVDRPLPSWLVYPVLFAAVFLSHLALIRLPYYWDEAGYYIPAAWDFFRTGSLIPSSTLSNAHPPLPSIYLALWWWASGFTPVVTRTAVCVISSLALLGVWRLSLRYSHSPAVAGYVTLLTGLYPVWFAQSTLAHADIFAACATLWALDFYLRGSQRSIRVACILFAVAALCKETSILIPMTLVLCQLYRVARNRGERQRGAMQIAAALSLTVVPLLGWYFYHHHKTGFFFGNPEFLRYNATSNASPVRFAAALLHRVLHLSAHMNLFVPVLCAVGCLFLEPLNWPNRTTAVQTLRTGSRLHQDFTNDMFAVVAVNLLAFSAIGGALLTRYLLPLYPLVLLACVVTFASRVRYWQPLCVLAAAGFIAGIVINPPYRFAPEDNLAYRDSIQLQQEAIRQLWLRYPDATVLTAWPVTDELTKPELGYVRHSFSVVPVEDFTLDHLAAAANANQSYSAAILFSTKYDPPQPLLTLGTRSQALDRRYFGLHIDMSPEEAAHLLNGQVVWQNEVQGQWVALLHFDRPQVASFTLRQNALR